MPTMLSDASRATGGALAVLAACAVLTGCGKTVSGTASAAAPDGSTGDLSGRIATMNDAVHYHMIAKKSVHSTFVMNVPGRTVHGSTDYEFHRDNVDMRYTMNLSGLVPGGRSSKGGDTSGQKGRTVELRIIDNVLYEKIPILSTGKPWVKIDPNGSGPLAKSTGPMIEMLQQNNDPTKFLEVASKAGEITKTTHETIDNQATTHYSIRIDTQKMLNRVQDAPLPQLAQRGAANLPPSYPVDIWINDDKLPVRMTMKPPTPGKTTQQMRTDFTGWGKPVDIEKPPDDKIGHLDLPSLPGSSSTSPTAAEPPTQAPETN